MTAADEPVRELEPTDALEAPTQAVSQWVRLRRARDIDLADSAQRRFGDYELIERLGVGGMGAVYRARQLSLEREVALKLVGVDAEFGEELIAAFHSEARHAGRLQHPNIVPVYEIGSVDHLYFFSMGLVRGPTLQRWFSAEAQPGYRDIAALLRRIAEAIEYAHGVGVLHLDLKPGNVLIDPRGEPQVSDFGLAQRLDSEARGQSVGTPGYMAPEQARRGSVLSPATDVWGLGAILYRLLCGRAPVAAEGAEIRDWTVTPPRQVRAEVPADLSAICMRCLQEAPEQRYPSARALAEDLHRYEDGRAVSVRRQGAFERIRGWARREPRSAGLALGLLLSLLTGLAASTRLWLSAEGHRLDAQTTLWQARRDRVHDDAARGDPLLSLPALVENIAEAEQAGQKAHVWADRLRMGLLMRQAPRVIAVWPQGDEGRSLAFARDGELLLVGLRGGELRALDTRDGRTRWQLTPPFPPTPWGASYVGRIVPTKQGRHALLYPSGSSGVVRPDTSAMQRVELDSGDLAAPPAEFTDFEASSYSVDGGRALLRSRDGALQLWQVEPWHALGPRFDGQGARYCLPLVDRAEVACAREGFTRVVLLDAGTGRSRDDFRFEDRSELLSWSSDAGGRWLALGSSSGALYLHDLESGRQHRFDEVGEGGVVELAFAGRWLTVAYAGGSLRLLDLAGPRWSSPRLRVDSPALNAARMDNEGRWLLANDGRLTLWSMGESEDALQPRSRQVLRHAGAVIGFHAFALDAAHGRMASHGNGGEIKLFQLPPVPRSVPVGGLQPGEAESAAAPGALMPPVSGLIRGDGTPQHPGDRVYRWEYAMGGTRAVLAAGSSLWLGGTGTDSALRELPLPGSAQVLLTAAQAERALVAWIDAAVPVGLCWRLLDTGRAQWLGTRFCTRGRPDGQKLSASGAQLLLWQGQRLEQFDTDAGQAAATLELPEASGLRISDAAFDIDGREARIVLATRGRSVVQPATLERWQLHDGAWHRSERLATPFAHARVLALRDGLLGHGPRPALYAGGQRIELGNLGADYSEHAAVSPDGGLAALGTRRGLLLIDLARRSPLLPLQALPFAADDALASLAFNADGDALELRSHYGQRLRFSLVADTRPVAELQLEAEDLSPRSSAPSLIESPQHRALRKSRDVAQGTSAVPRVSPSDASALPESNVAVGQRFQGSRGGLGITDSAAWPQGRLRLRGADYELGAALQLAPAGRALGAAVFPSESSPLPLPEGSGPGVELLMTQQGAESAWIECDWLDAEGRVLARHALAVPPAADPQAEGQTLAPVALWVRTAESRLRGGGSPLLNIYALTVRRPAAAAPARFLRLRALDAAPLLLGLRGLEAPAAAAERPPG